MARLPLVACFHGGGSNSTIFSVQSARLQKYIEGDAELVFFDGPYESKAGPGVLPVFEDYAPFRTWFKARSDGSLIDDGSGYDAKGTDGVERAWKMMETRAPKEQWIGAMGFSQGTRVVGGLLLDQQRRSQKNESNGFNLRFGILCMGGGAPMETKHDDFQEYKTATTDAELVTIPTLHLHGLKDAILPNGRKQKDTHYSQEASTLCEIEYHHAMPWNMEDLGRFSNLIKKLLAKIRA